MRKAMLVFVAVMGTWQLIQAACTTKCDETTYFRTSTTADEDDGTKWFQVIDLATPPAASTCKRIWRTSSALNDIAGGNAIDRKYRQSQPLTICTWECLANGGVPGVGACDPFAPKVGYTPQALTCYSLCIQDTGG